MPWLALPDIRKLHGKVAMQTTENTNGLGLANSSARLLPVNTVCVSRTASIGFVTLLGRPMATSQDFCNWICKPDELDAEFLMYAFMASQDYLRELGSGAVHKTIYCRPSSHSTSARRNFPSNDASQGACENSSQRPSSCKLA